MNQNQGWECPKCKSVWAPWNPQCLNCGTKDCACQGKGPCQCNVNETKTPDNRQLLQE